MRPFFSLFTVTTFTAIRHNQEPLDLSVHSHTLTAYFSFSLIFQNSASFCVFLLISISLFAATFVLCFSKKESLEHPHVILFIDFFKVRFLFSYPQI